MHIDTKFLDTKFFYIIDVIKLFVNLIISSILPLKIFYKNINFYILIEKY